MAVIKRLSAVDDTNPTSGRHLRDDNDTSKTVHHIMYKLVSISCFEGLHQNFSTFH